MKRIIVAALLSATFLNTFAHEGIEDMPGCLKSNLKGRVKSKISYTEHGTSTTNYDPNGWELNTIYKKDNGQITKSEIIYDKSGRPIKTDSYTLRYNNQGQLISRIEHGRWEYYSELEYTPSGDIFRVIYYRSRGTHDVLAVFNYDGNGNKAEAYSFKSGSKGWWPTGVAKYEYDDTTQIEKLYNIGWQDQSLRHDATNIYDRSNHNKLKLYQYIHKEDSIIMLNPWTYEYDKYGNQIKRVKIDNGDTITFTTKYVYDDKGNILEKKMYKNGVEDRDSYKYAYIYYPDNTPIKKEPAKYIGVGPTATLENQGKWHSSFEKLEKLANAGNVSAQSRLGYYYLTGTGIPFDISKAVEWLTKAAEKGNAEAQYQLGFLYLTGTGVNQSEGFANEWMLKAAKQGHKKACYDVAIYYLDALNDDADIDKGIEYLKKSVANGNAAAKALLDSFTDKTEEINKLREEQKKRRAEKTNDISTH
ncbi:MAG: SEL1-like repeat protein [Bacteroidales bacterium]|nr:SEL1-like repeat protein [Candidatus Scybalocola fimicaballi]